MLKNINSSEEKISEYLDENDEESKRTGCDEDHVKRNSVEKNINIELKNDNNYEATETNKSSDLHTNKTTTQKIKIITPGPKGLAREASMPEEIFSLLFNNKAAELILLHTNSEIFKLNDLQNIKHLNAKEMTEEELRAYIGLLYLIAAKRGDKISTDLSWSICDSSFYNAVMSKVRFSLITHCLRFNDCKNREVKKAVDPFTDIRELWEIVMHSFISYYQPSTECTVDTQIINYITSCKLETNEYIPKTDGIKIFLMCDARTPYVVTGLPYIGKTTTIEDLHLNEYYLIKLTEPVHHTNTNITCSKWFTTVSAAKRLLKDYGITIVGILKNYMDIPIDMLTTDGRPVDYNIMQVIMYNDIKGRTVALLSSMHRESPTYDFLEALKIKRFYNETKGGVDSIQKILNSYSCSQLTGRWPLAVFYYIIDLIGINCYTILNKTATSQGRNMLSRRQFLYNLAFQLVIPHLMQRTYLRNIRSNIKIKIHDLIQECQDCHECHNLQEKSYFDECKKVQGVAEEATTEKRVVLWKFFQKFYNTIKPCLEPCL